MIMLLSKEFLQLLDEKVRVQLEYWSKFKPSKEAKEMWKYKNSSDFWYGHTIGLLTGIENGIFLGMYHRTPT